MTFVLPDAVPVTIKYVLETPIMGGPPTTRYNNDSGTELTETPNGILMQTPGGGTKVLTPWHRIVEVWYR